MSELNFGVFFVQTKALTLLMYNWYSTANFDRVQFDVLTYIDNHEITIMVKKFFKNHP